MSQSYLIFAQGGKLEVIRGSVTLTIIHFADKTLTVSEGELAEKLSPIIRQLEKGEIQFIKVITPDAADFFENLKSCYDKFIIAAGGIVKNKKGELLVIFRNGKWDLPKGKIEKGEKIADGALREVQEETGLKKLKMLSEFHRTYHTYVMGEKRVLKETIWFSMLADDEETTPQREEGITKIKWATADELDAMLANTYENISLLLKKFFGKFT